MINDEVGGNYSGGASIANGQSISVNITLSKDVNVGLAVFKVRHTGASDINMNNAHWIVTGLIDTSWEYAGGLEIFVGKTWDSSATATALLYNVKAGTYTVTFTNNTGATTNPTYNSAVSVKVIRLC